MRITLSYSPRAREVDECAVDLEPGATLRDALAASGLAQRHPGIEALPCGIWGRKAAPDALLREGDRVEFWRALRVDPKVARRERFQSQGARSAGLFTQRRAGAKAGY